MTRHLIVLGAIIFGLAGVALLILLWPTFLADQVSTTSDRIALAQIFIEAAAVVAIFIAVWEFGQAQRKPELRVLIANPNIADPSKAIVFTVPSTSQGEVFLPLRFLLENKGKAAARWVKIKTTLEVYPQMAMKVTNFEPGTVRAPGTWTMLAERRTYTFTGDDSFIAYARPKKVEFLRDWVDNLGDFSLVVRMDEGPYGGPFAALRTSTWADGISRHDQEFEFLVERTEPQ